MDTFPDQYPYVAGFLLSIVVSASMVVIVYRLIRKPFLKVTTDIERLAEGKLIIEKDEQLSNAKDELGLLHRSIYALAIRLGNAFENLENISERINYVGTELNNTSDDLTISATNQATSLEEISASMEEMAANIRMNSENSGKTEKIAIDANHAVIQGNNAAVTALESMKEIAENIQIINELSEVLALLKSP